MLSEVFAGLCAHTCNDLRQELVNGEYYTTQDLQVAPTANCAGDDNPAALAWHTALGPGERDSAHRYF